MDLQRPLVLAAHVAIALGIAYVVWRGVSFLLFGADPGARQSPGQAARPDAAPPTVAIDELAGLHLFGRPPPRSAAASAERLAETRLSLVLIGVIVAHGRAAAEAEALVGTAEGSVSEGSVAQGAFAEPPVVDGARASIAFIASRAGPVKSYRIGDRLPGNATLVAVHQDRVVIRRGGVREQLRFEAPKPMVRPVGERRSARARAATGRLPEQQAASRGERPGADAYREALASDPRQLLADLGLGQQAGEGGYTIGALADRPELSHTGLKRGDRILSVNGRPVGDPDRDRQEIENILAQGSASIEVQRGDRRFMLTVSLR